MSHSRGAYTKGSKEQKEFDGTILTHKYYDAITTVGGNQGKAKEYFNNQLKIPPR